jgi:hypothetical protein
MWTALSNRGLLIKPGVATVEENRTEDQECTERLIFVSTMNYLGKQDTEM